MLGNTLLVTLHELRLELFTLATLVLLADLGLMLTRGPIRAILIFGGIGIFVSAAALASVAVPDSLVYGLRGKVYEANYRPMVPCIDRSCRHT
jgi:hypothetical protein